MSNYLTVVIVLIVINCSIPTYLVAAVDNAAPLSNAEATQMFFKDPQSFMTKYPVHSFLLDKKPIAGEQIHTGLHKFKLKYQPNLGYGIKESKKGVEAYWVNTGDKIKVDNPLSNNRLVLTSNFIGCNFRASVKTCKDNKNAELHVYHQTGRGTLENANRELKADEKHFLKGDVLSYDDYRSPDKIGKQKRINDKLSRKQQFSTALLKNDGNGKWSYVYQGIKQNLGNNLQSNSDFSKRVQSIKINRRKPVQTKTLDNVQKQLKSSFPNQVISKPPKAHLKTSRPSTSFKPIKLGSSTNMQKPPKAQLRNSRIKPTGR